ncbi:translation initiation factor IF-1 [Candidatus Woesebacteria bacterium RIFOXYB1_FULL_38_16]|uniref:Translation initiation factor IF-1 n=1 Tax=Candidatus Woesebacteria bacterium RIFOXYB1_FULL_38_16 TaxID=1802538 RepID=A0A1F8CUR6_9BACT|nr:MAG: translation initiation factor IF-1 [Candidatus Woesebacteria bacterium RIFOXYA1_FULL_38_9]OGM80060.1 MAG: translation initiation factor IF-1 [Candidatus Woesebacteria bacterium RIFOXYB1_FULL_38_16]
MRNNPKNTIVEGEILEALPNTMFRVRLVDGKLVLTVPSGKMRRGFMRLFPGAKVRVEMTPYDKDRGRIVGSSR